MKTHMMFSLRRCLRQVSYSFFRNVKTKSRFVLGIETSCDDTGAAVVDENGNILGEALSSQMQVHLENGGIIPHIARYLHAKNINNVVTSALRQSGLDLQDISAFAATVKPGIGSSLLVGLEKGKELSREACKPLIPIHHMEAHSLTIRMIEDVQFPFLVLLASGGHCQIAVVKNVEEFLLLGTSQHNSPGEVLDKIARRLKLQNLPQCYNMSGGCAIEFMAQNGNPLGYNVPHSMVAYRDCNFSFSGYGSYAISIIEEEEKLHDVPADGVIPHVEDFCASIQHGYALHMMHRVERAFMFCDLKNILPEDNRTLVFSGGVACNTYIRNALRGLCDSLNYRFACPPPKLCTDNGIMIAWNGMEKLKKGVGMHYDLDNIKPDPDCPLGIDMSSDVKKASIKVKIPKLKSEHKSELDEAVS